ncbi:hypothetical protein [Micromonospora chersina]
MAHILLLHSVFGLRPAVLAAADRLRAAGHRVATPDLYEVPAAETVEAGFALFEKIGRDTVLDRARAAVLPPLEASIWRIRPVNQGRPWADCP